MSDNFHQILWQDWLEKRVNWGRFDFDEIPTANDEPSDGVRDRRRLWKRYEHEMEWALQDSNLFYYPLFGLGLRENPDVAIIGAGPAYNDRAKWQQFTSQSDRETVHGPPTDADKWLTSFSIDKEYERIFDAQRNIWQKARDPNFDDSDTTKPNTLVIKLRKLLNNIDNVTFDDSEDSVFNEVYFTNFMKDGELKNANLDWSDWSNSWISKFGTPSEDTLRFKAVDNPLIPDKSTWPATNREGANSGQKFCVELARITSREFWLPVLGAELAEVDPSIILAVGRPALHAVYQLYNVGSIKDTNITTIDDPENLVVNNKNKYEDNPVIMSVPHWANNNWNNGEWSPEVVAEFIDQNL